MDPETLIGKPVRTFSGRTGTVLRPHDRQRVWVALTVAIENDLQWPPAVPVAIEVLYDRADLTLIAPESYTAEAAQ